MAVTVFDGEKDAYWWVLCIEKFFNEQGTPEAMKLPKAVTAFQGSAHQWWLWRSQHLPQFSWEMFTTIFLWCFKPEYHDILPIDIEEEESKLESLQSAQGSFMNSFSPIIVDQDFAYAIKDPPDSEIRESAHTIVNGRRRTPPREGENREDQQWRPCHSRYGIRRSFGSPLST